ncbi:MAG TPA: CaiB/BaiF CoA-transferase family protein [Microthrixaceae bacterium]|nr:CaiB/BaiF CoA-transferase family protein [Microthrixaceae bacterium]HMT25637.1 CaiB/BaiF CoA-transferase family protein [Microthrixaceae bacterium]HMT62765.1 CaiB/BaiF CoA-transferase family protein [Microthrixaceae bacterium]
MSGPLDGIRVIEVASWMFVPSGGSVLVDWGADVIKVEHPETGDPQRGLITSGLLPGGKGAVNFMIEQPNRGKRSVGIDLATADGREVLMKLVETADVFLTNYLPHVRAKLGIDVDDLRAVNPNLIIARGSGAGPLGPDAAKGGYDGASFWARGGVGVSMPDREGWPPGQPTPAFGDVMGGLTIAGAIAAALLKRERTGEPSVVDVSLLATAMWQVSPMIIASKLFGFSKIPQGDRTKSPNPGVGTYRTADDRHIALILLQSDKHSADFVERLGVPDMATDPKFADAAARAQNSGECIARLDEAFGAHPLDYWKDALATFDGVWSPFQTLDELYDDVQVQANGYLPTMTAGNGDDVQLVASPAQFDETAVSVQRAPEHGEHTELVLMDLGYDWDRIAEMKDSGAVL